MQSDPVKTYSDARTAYNKSTSQILEFGNHFKQAGQQMLDNWLWIGVPDLGVQGQIPEAGRTPQTIFLLKRAEWLSFDELAQLITKAREQRAEQNSAWDKVSPEDKKNLQFPLS
jgi:hypothetical protein